MFFSKKNKKKNKKIPTKEIEGKCFSFQKKKIKKKRSKKQLLIRKENS